MFTTGDRAISMVGSRNPELYSMFSKFATMTAVFLVLSALPMAANGQTLPDALRLAYENNPQLEAERTATKIAQEQVESARAQWRSQVSLSASAGVETVDSSFSNPFFGQGQFGERPSVSAQLQATKPIYAGGQINAGIRQAKAGVNAANEQLSAAEQDLFLQAVTTYVDVLRDRETVKIRENNVSVLQEQVRAATDRFEVGEITRTDVSLSEARLEGAKANLASAEAQLEASLAAYMFLIGEEPGALAPPPSVPPLPQSLDEAVAVALGDSPDINAARFAARAADEAIKGAYGRLKPQVSIVGTAAVQETFDYGDFNQGQRDTSVGAFAQATIPLFEGGLVQSQVRSAKLERSRARSQVDALQRQIRAQVAQAYYRYQASLKSIDASMRQEDAAEIAYEGAKEELAVGVRTTLAVLDQEQELFEARLNVVRAERDSYVAAHQLLRAMGALSLDRLNVAAKPFDPSEYKNEIEVHILPLLRGTLDD